ncbi:hypothetical protein V1525DRAFT_388798 [Lipomyces kononenkoae]|uniref:Uncharacterized protein n=1 Tax=Lipomyces kononenkoae TaxID=34357 RepID=A0ACC3T0X2_LIPKO
MASTTLTLVKLMCATAWTCLVVSHAKHPIFNQVLSSQEVIEEVVSSASLAFAPGLLDVLQAHVLPSITWLKTLPTHTGKKIWGVYLLVLEKEGWRPLIYVGSGTSHHGVIHRFDDYDKRSFVLGTDAPFALVAVTRLVFVTFEATFSLMFLAVKWKTDYASGLAPWNRESLEYDGLCSHIAFQERPNGDHNLSSEQLEAQAAEMLEKKRTRHIRRNKKFIKNNPEAVKAIWARYHLKAIEEKRFYCKICDKAFDRSGHYNRHLRSQRHATKAAGPHRAETQKRFYCKVCDNSYSSSGHYNTHLSSRWQLPDCIVPKLKVAITTDTSVRRRNSSRTTLKQRKPCGLDII